MSDINTMVAYDDGDIDTNRSANAHMSDLIATRLSRRQTLRHGVSAMTTALFGGALLAGCDDENPQAVTVSGVSSSQPANSAPPNSAVVIADTPWRSVWRRDRRVAIRSLICALVERLVSMSPSS